MNTNKKATGKKVATKKQATKKVSEKPLDSMKKAEPEKVPNPYKVPAKLWKGFGSKGQVVYNGVMEQSERIKQRILIHPQQRTVGMEKWGTTRHNFACLAAWATKEI